MVGGRRGPARPRPGGGQQHSLGTIGGGAKQRVRRAAQRRRLPGVGHHAARARTQGAGKGGRRCRAASHRPATSKAAGGPRAPLPQHFLILTLAPGIMLRCRETHQRTWQHDSEAILLSLLAPHRLIFRGKAQALNRDRLDSASNG
jgi:hypothetical protein